MQRRDVLSTVSTALVASLAGCSGSDSDGGESDDSYGGDPDEGDADTAGPGTTDDKETGETVYGGTATDLGFGDSYVSPQQMETVVHGIDLTETLTYETSDGTEQKDAGDGTQFALVRFEATNEAGSGSYLPPLATVSLSASGETYSVTRVENAEGQYDSGSVDNGVSRTGWIAYEIPADLTVAELAVTYDRFGEDDWSATWQAQ